MDNQKTSNITMNVHCQFYRI